MKKNNFLTYLTLMVLACSCTIMGRPGLMEAYTFEMGYDNLQKETDKFVEENPNINRYYNEDGFGYDTGEYREYEIICKKDTFLASVYFIDRPDLYKDSLRRIGVPFFRFHNVHFSGVDYKPYLKNKKKNKKLYNSCEECFKTLFINPLKERIGENIKPNVLILKNKFLATTTATMLIDTLKKYPNDVMVITKIKSNFCSPIFIEELSSFSKDKTPCSNIESQYKKVVVKHKETNVSLEVKLLLERIKKECR